MTFIGVYDYTVILTYLSFLSAMLGILQASRGHFGAAIGCLIFSGVCDMFDGIVARSKKNRTEDEKNFGIQLDSLCDVVSFGVFPALLLYFQGVQSGIGVAILCFYALCALIRLAFFNVLEINRQKTEGGCAKAYRGLPVTSAAIVYPFFYLLAPLLPDGVNTALHHILPVLMGFLFILDFRVPKIDFGKLLGITH